MSTFEPEKNPVPAEVNVPQIDVGVTKSKTSILTIIGVLLILASVFLPLIFESSKDISEPISVWFSFPGFIIGAICLLVVLTSTESRLEGMTAKVFLIIPFLLIAVISLIAGPLALLFFAIAGLAALLFIKTNVTKGVALKTVAWLVGIAVYALIGFLEILLINPPSIYYGTPMYRPKTK